MSIKITQKDANTYQVNGKEVYKDMNGKWVASSEMTVNEINSFQRHIRSAEYKTAKTPRP